jgi:hypothetical protein
VSAGDLTQEQADAKSADVTERITAMVNGEAKFGPGVRRFEHRPIADATPV